MKKFTIIILLAALHFTALCQNVVQGEYFIDTDLGYGNNTLVNFAPTSDGTFNLSITVSSYTPGFHKLYIRTKDDSGRWSLTARRNIEVLASEVKTTIVNGEYFIDTDPGFGLATPLSITSPDSILLQSFTAATSILSEGYHKLYGRLLDNYGRWGFTFRRNIEIYKSDTNKVLNGEYFFKTDLGFGSCDGVSFAVPAADGSYLINIPRTTIPADADTLFLRVRDDIENRWSITQIMGNISGILPLTLVNFSVTKQNNVAQLAWQTSSEISTSHFNIQRSTNGIDFSTVGSVNAAITSVSRHDYTYPDDISSLATGKVYYRLQIVDNDGKFTYSKIVYITLVNSLQIRIYPNPAHGYFVIGNYDKLDVRTASVFVRDLMGRTLINQKFTNDTEQKINIGSLSKGMYTISIVTPGEVQTQKLIAE